MFTEEINENIVSLSYNGKRYVKVTFDSLSFAKSFFNQIKLEHIKRNIKLKQNEHEKN